MIRIFDVIIVGGSYSGMAAAMALGRARRHVLIIDSGKPCNAQTPQSHNFLSRDGATPTEIAAIARQQVLRYPTINFFEGIAIKGIKTANGFEIQVASGETFVACKLVFATGIHDLLPAVPGMAECWGISVLHCPFCHGYEVKDAKTGILGNGDAALSLASLITNWTDDLTMFTNGPSYLTTEQNTKLRSHKINVIEKEIARLEQYAGNLKEIVFKDGTLTPLKAAYVRSDFRQACQLPEMMGCKFTEDGYIQVDTFHQSSVPGVFACGDNINKIRTVANAVAAGTTTGMNISKTLITAEF
ncbi:NAD(P)/FAD-dependent oxidoreductase [Inquilinus sp. KBS0705]|nr:NAD(P)/FAD-dependent oxidoreductase [Inquilinus sp. KBS0705]